MLINHPGGSRQQMDGARPCLIGTVVAICLHAASAQLVPFQSASPLTQTQSSAAATAIDLTGLVVDARNRNPIARALVRLNNRAVLTDHDGIFTFPQVNPGTATFTVAKPGFFPSPDGDATQPRSYQIPATKPIELSLYPEAIVTGSVVDPAGEGIGGLTVTAQRSVFDEYGHRWMLAARAQTSNAGEFRLTVPSGSYMLNINQRGRPASGTAIVMPLTVPASGSSDSAAMKLLFGEEKHVALRADVRRAYTVSLHVEPELRGFPTITATAADGISIPLSAMPSRESGEVRVTLPSGSYTLHGLMQNPDGLAEGQTQVTVTDHDLSGAVLRLSRAASLPVVIEVDSSAAPESNARSPDANQLGLTLQSSRADAALSPSTIRVAMQKPGAPSFPVPAGVYRLHAQAGGGWYIASATCGGIDLLTQELPVSAGLDGVEVRVRISNNTANLSGKVTVSGSPGSAWVYLLATNPSANPVLVVRANSDGSFFRPYLVPGSYRVVALERRVNADLQNSAVLSAYLDRVQSVTITPGEQRTLALDAVPERELAP